MKTMPAVFTLTVAAGFLTAVCATASASALFQNDDHLIVPDKRIGPVALGMSDQALFKLRVPDITAPNGSLIVYIYNDVMRIFVDRSTHKVFFVEVYDRSYHTVDGLRIGSRLTDIGKAMGPAEKIGGDVRNPGDVRRVIYNSGNLEFNFIREEPATMAYRPRDTVQNIAIQSPGAGMF